MNFEFNHTIIIVKVMKTPVFRGLEIRLYKTYS